MQIFQQIIAALTALVIALSAQVGNLSQNINPQSQLAQVAPTSGLVGYWKFDEGSGTTVADSSGNGNNGNAVNDPTWTTGRMGGGLDLNSGTTKNQYVSLPDIISSDADFTISVWANIRLADYNAPFISRGTSVYRSGVDWGFWIYPGGNLEARRGGNYVMSTSKVSFNSWHNYATVVTSSGTFIYIDGVKVTTGGIMGTAIKSGLTTMAGSATAKNLDGVLDNIRVYNRALSGSEILDIYNSENEGSIPLIPPTPAPSDTTPPVISSVTSSSVTTSSSIISWTTDENSDSQVEYGLTSSYGAVSTLNSSLTLPHSANLSSLSPNTLYHYRVKSKDSAGNLTVSSDYSFSTLAPTPSVPVITSFGANPTSVTLGNASLLSWSVSGATSVTIDNGVGSQSSLTTGSVSVSPTQSTTYQLTATNSAGAVNASVTVSVTSPIVTTGQIISQHPRLYDTAYLESLKNKKNGTAEQKQLWNSVQSYINSYCTGSSYGVSKSFGCMDSLALGYVLDNTKTDYANKACELMAYNLDGNDGNPGGLLDDDTDIRSGNSFRWYGPSLALTYDLLSDYCTDAQKNIAKDAFTRAWNIYNSNSTVTNGKFFVIKEPSRVSNNLAIGQLNTMARMAVAVYDPASFPQAETWLNEIIDIFRTKVLLCPKNSTAVEPYESCFGGAWPEGAEYAPETKKLFMNSLEAIRSGTGGKVNLFNESGQLAEQLLNYHLLTSSPTGKQGTYNKLFEPYPYRDVQKSGYFYTPDRQLMLALSEYFKRVGDGARLGYTQWWLNNIQPKHYLISNSNGGLELLEFMKYDPSISAMPYLGSISTDLQTPFMLVSRSDNSENATWAGFQAMIEKGDHMHGDAGQYQIYRKGEWLTQEIPGYMGGNYVQANASHNSPILNWHGSMSGANRGGSSDGWAKFTRTPGGWKSECNSNYCYAQADLTPVYRFTGYRITADVQKVTRDFLYLKPDLFVVADNYQYVSGLNAMSINPVQSREPITVSGNRATISKGSQKLYVNVVAPTQAKMQTFRQDSCKVLGAKKIDNNQMDVYVDCWYGAGNQNISISGATGEWSAINGAWVLTQPQSSQTSPYSDGIAYNGERFRITSTSNAFASISSTWPFELSGVATTNLVKNIQVNNVALNAYRVDISSGQYLNKESHFYVLQTADSGTSPMLVSDRSTASANAGQFGDYIVATPKDPSVIGDIEYAVGGTGRPITHYIFGLVPQNSYQVVTSVPGKITIKQGGSYMASASGLLTFQTEASGTTISPPPLPPPPPTDGSTKFIVGQRIKTTSNLNVRASASATGTLLGTQPLGSIGTIVSGGTIADNYYWWNVNYDNAPDGYSVENYLTAYTTPPTLTVGDFNHDGLVNSVDFSLMVTAWNTSNSIYDLNQDSMVNSLDYTIMVQDWSL